MMFGRIRATSSSPESLERLPSKILKENSLSIYEATLAKLKLGSQRDLSSSPKDAELETANTLSSLCSESTKMEPYFTLLNTAKDSTESTTKDLMAIDFDCSSRISQDSANSKSTESSKLLNKKASILSLFAKFKSSQHRSSNVEAMTAEDEYLATISPGSSSCIS